MLSAPRKSQHKRSKFEDYRLTSRGKKGVSTINITEKTGKLMCMRAVTGKEDAMIVASDGIMIRVALENVGIYGRNTQGVRLINLNGDAKVTRMTLVDHEEPEVESEEEGNWDEVMIVYAKNCLKHNHEFKGVVKIVEIEARASRNSVNW